MDAIDETAAALGKRMGSRKGRRRTLETTPTPPDGRSAKCQVCRHRDRMRIEIARLSGDSLDNIQMRFGVHRDAVWNHMKLHVDEADRAAMVADLPMKELARVAAEEGMSVLDYLKVIREILMRAILVSAHNNDHRTLAKVSQQAIQCLQQLGKITGELSTLSSYSVTHNTAIFTASPQFAALQSMLVERLRDGRRRWLR